MELVGFFSVCLFSLEPFLKRNLQCNGHSPRHRLKLKETCLTPTWLYSVKRRHLIANDPFPVTINCHNQRSPLPSANPLARALRVPSGRIVDILNGKRAMRAETALRLGCYFGNDARFWINLQAQYELALARRDVGARVMREVETAA
jgi:antitoxin HigA-1